MNKFTYDSDPIKDNITNKSKILFNQYPDGSWEYAALSVYNDAQMQLGLNLLTYAIEVQKKADMHLLPILLDRLHTSAILLMNSHIVAEKYGCISSSKSDLHKNTAMSWMRMQGILGIALNFKDNLVAQSQANPEMLQYILPHNSGILEDLVTPESYSSILQEAKHIISSYLQKYPNDKDRSAFQQTVDSMDKAYAKLHNTSTTLPNGSDSKVNTSKADKSKMKNKKTH